MKRTFIALFAAGILLGGYACDTEDDPTNEDQEEVADQDANQEIRYEIDNCEPPNAVFGNNCCSIQGTWAGTCKLDMDWISSGGCRDEFVKGGLQYCCGGQYLSDMRARGFQCILE